MSSNGEHKKSLTKSDMCPLYWTSSKKGILLCISVCISVLGTVGFQIQQPFALCHDQCRRHVAVVLDMVSNISRIGKIPNHNPTASTGTPDAL